MTKIFENLNKIQNLMCRIDESYHENMLLEYDDFEKRWIDELNTLYREEGVYGKRLYHSAGIHSWSPMEQVIKSICQSGLSVDSATDGDGIGKVIWFSDDFSDYAENGAFVVSIQLTGENRVKFGLGYDGHNGYAEKDIPIEALTIEVVPLFKSWFGFYTNKDIEKEFRKKLGRSAFEDMMRVAKDNQVTMYIDAWDYIDEPYDLNVIEQFDNIKIDKFGIK